MLATCATGQAISQMAVVIKHQSRIVRDFAAVAVVLVIVPALVVAVQRMIVPVLVEEMLSLTALALVVEAL